MTELDIKKKNIRLLLQVYDYSYDPDTEDEYHMYFFKCIDGNLFKICITIQDFDELSGILLRGEFVENFDKWGNATYQRHFKDVEDFKKNWNRFWWYEEEEEEE